MATAVDSKPMYCILPDNYSDKVQDIVLVPEVVPRVRYQFQDHLHDEDKSKDDVTDPDKQRQLGRLETKNSKGQGVEKRELLPQKSSLYLNFTCASHLFVMLHRHSHYT